MSLSSHFSSFHTLGGWMVLDGTTYGGIFSILPLHDSTLLCAVCHAHARNTTPGGWAGVSRLHACRTILSLPLLAGGRKEGVAAVRRRGMEYAGARSLTHNVRLPVAAAWCFFQYSATWLNVGGHRSLRYTKTHRQRQKITDSHLTNIYQRLCRHSMVI